MARNDALSTKQALFVAALIEADDVRGAATQAGVSERTAWRWLGQAGVQAAVAARQDALLGQVTAAIASDMADARRALLAIINDAASPPGAKVRAAAAVLGYGLKLWEVRVLERRIEALEARLEAAHECRGLG